MEKIAAFLEGLADLPPAIAMLAAFGALLAYYLKNEAKAPPPAGPNCHADPGVMEVLRRMEQLLVRIETMLERRR